MGLKTGKCYTLTNDGKVKTGSCRGCNADPGDACVFPQKFREVRVQRMASEVQGEGKVEMLSPPGVQANENEDIEDASILVPPDVLAAQPKHKGGSGEAPSGAPGPGEILLPPGVVE